MDLFLNWMNNGGRIPYPIAIPLLLLAFFAPMVAFAGIYAPLIWLNSVYNAIMGIS